MVAFCYLYQADDQRNLGILTSNALIIRRKGKDARFALDDIKVVNFKEKRLLFPLVIGGVASTMATIAIFKNVFDPWAMLITMMVGLFLLYMGWQGSKTLTITTSVKEYDFFLRSVSKNLEAFTNFVNGNLASGSNMTASFFIPVSRAAWNDIQANGGIEPKEGVIRLYMLTDLRKVSQQISGKEFTLLIVDTEKLPFEVKFESHGNDGQLHPYCYGKIPIEALKEYNP